MDRYSPSEDAPEMFSSLKLGKPLGVDLFIHPTFWVLPILIFFSGVMSGDLAGAVLDVGVIFALFACVVLHEFGHAMAAAYYGVRTRHITMYPIGGVAALERMPERPLHEIVVALAGPAVNVVIAFGLLAVLVVGNIALPNSITFEGMNWFDEFLVKLFGINVFLVAFNLLPAFPMDGGRVFRAMLSTMMRRVEATRLAVTVGSILAGIFVLSGLGLIAIPFFNDGTNLSLVLVGAVVFLLGRMELAQVQAIEARQRWERRQQADFENAFDPPIAEVISRPQFSGWKFDPERRVWSEWRNGMVVQEVRGF